METKITKKRNHPLDNSSLVDQTLRISNFRILVGLLKIQGFINALHR